MSDISLTVSDSTNKNDTNNANDNTDSTDNNDKKKLLLELKKRNCCEICCNTDCEISRECCKKIPCKRYFLPLSLSIGVVWLPEMRHYVYLPLIVGFSFLIVFWNYPKLVYFTASKPLYYEDLFIDSTKLPNYEVNRAVKKKFNNIFTAVLVITNSILVAALSDYWLFKVYEDRVISNFEIIGVTGGILKIFQIINNTIARFMLKLLRCFILNENRETEQKQNIEIFKLMNVKLQKN